MTAASIILGIVLGLVFVAWTAGRVGAARMRALYERERASLLARARSGATASRAADALDAVPEPVRRYLRTAGSTEDPGPRAATLHQTGGIRTAPDKPWMPFRSEQTYSFDPPGFTWFARARVAPGVEIVARDRFVDERGHMLIRLGGFITVADAVGPEIDQGAALRFWGEVLFFPEVALHPRLRWEPMDDTHVRLHVLGAMPLEAVVEFGEDGLPAAFHADRYRDVGGGRSVLTPWTGHCTDWRVIDGRRFPTRWSSVWHLQEGDFEAVRMTVERVDVTG